MFNKSKINEIFFDYYNNRWVKTGIGLTLTACTSHNGSGTMWIITRKDNDKDTSNLCDRDVRFKG